MCDNLFGVSMVGGSPAGACISLTNSAILQGKLLSWQIANSNSGLAKRWTKGCDMMSLTSLKGTACGMRFDGHTVKWYFRTGHVDLHFVLRGQSPSYICKRIICTGTCSTSFWELSNGGVQEVWCRCAGLAVCVCERVARSTLISCVHHRLYARGRIVSDRGRNAFASSS